MKKVSVVVPVYNTERYLGYSINSILSQTYTEIEVILINDGSTDNSLKICNNYAHIDPRVKVVDIKNGGVGHARNIGIENASGYYLQFVDSDDVIAPDMIETFVHAIELYSKDIVFCGMKIVTLEDNNPEDIKECTSEGIGRECVLDRDVFFENMACLLWKTAMLEGPCNRLYKMDIVKKNQLKFPEDISLGEDFLFNMDYYEKCNGAVLLEQKLYYYLQVNNQALTKKVRQDLFENQMMLIERFEALLEKNVVVSEEEKKCISEYIMAKAIQCMKILIQSVNLSEDDKKAEIAKILNNKKVRVAVQSDGYIEPTYEWLKKTYKFCDVKQVYIKVKETFEEINNKEISLRTPGKINMCLVHILNRILKSYKSKKLEMVRNTLIDYGIKATVYKTIFYYKKGKNKN